MRHLPLDDPGTADHRSPGRFLWWLFTGQWRTMLAGIGLGIVWMVAQAVMPAVIGLAIDRGVAARDTSRLVELSGLLLGLGILQAAAGILRHRFAVTNWLTAAYRTVQLVTRHATHLGATLPRRVATGEVVAIGTNDLSHLGNAMDITARSAGAVASFLVVAVLLLQTSTTLGLVVLLGVPTLLLAIGPLLRPLQRRTLRQREMMGELSNLAGDIVSGLRVLRGIGGEHVFHERYVRESQLVRTAGVQVARLQSTLDAAQVLLPGIFVVVVVWLGARFAVRGDITPGELVAFYGYAAFLMMPLRTATEAANKWIRAFVAARRVCRVLALRPEVSDAGPLEEAPLAGPPAGSGLVDHVSGVEIRPGVMTAIVTDPPEDAALIADRLGRYTEAEVTWGALPLRAVPRGTVRRRILVSDTASMLFSGRLGEVLDPAGTGPSRGVVHAAAAEDIVAALPDGLDTVVAARGRTFSGGQRQRLVLTRALAADPEILILVEPTSAVDAHTEAVIADRLHRHRHGSGRRRTTVVTTTSPLMLDRADVVAFVRDGRLAAYGRHRHLLHEEPAYRHTVTREEEVAR